MATTAVQRSPNKAPGDRLYKQITQHVRTLISDGRLNPGDRLPSERNLASEFGVSHMTVRKGLSALVEEGLVDRRVGLGTFVADGTSSSKAAVSSKNASQTPMPAGMVRNHRVIAMAMGQQLRELPFVGHGVAGVREVLPQSEFGLEVLGIPQEGFGNEVLDVLRERSIDGLLYQGYLRQNDVARLQKAGVAVVKIGIPGDDVDCSCVWFDPDDLFQTIIKEAYRFGHRELALVQVGHTGMGAGSYITTCRRFNLLRSAKRHIVLPDVAGPDPAYVDTDRLFQLDPFPTCIVVNDEIIAAAVMRDLEANGYSVPDDVSVISMIDHTPNLHRVPLTAPDSNADLRSFYSIATKLLLEQIEGNRTQSVRRLEPTTLHVKASLAAPRLGNNQPSQNSNRHSQ